LVLVTTIGSEVEDPLELDEDELDELEPLELPP
jgi:hypothetical protein